ncbi:MAG: alpha/beta hydrolase-fold protein [Vicinamibacterales bacterium]
MQSQGPPELVRVNGALADGTNYTFVKPADWNGTVFVDLDSVGIDADYSKWLYAHGFARVGTTRVLTQWHIDKAIDNQVEALTTFTAKFGAPKRSIIFGNSLGALVAAGVAQKYPDRFAAALPHCGALAGSLSFWNTRLDMMFTLKTLLAPDAALPLVNIPKEVDRAVDAWLKTVKDAQTSPEGRARIALAAAVGQVPVWTSKDIAEPQEMDADARQQASYRTIVDSLLAQALRSGLQYEEASGGVAAWNTGVSYEQLLAKASDADRHTVSELYRKAGLDLRADLRRLATTPRIAADPAAVERAKKNVVFDGKLRIPVLAMNITGDPLAWSVYDTAYKAVVRREGKDELLRTTYVHGPGHCGFTGAERIATFEALLQRLDTGKWPDVSPAAMNARAMTAGTGAARFVDYKPATLNRMFFAGDSLGTSERR